MESRGRWAIILWGILFAVASEGGAESSASTETLLAEIDHLLAQTRGSEEPAKSWTESENPNPFLKKLDLKADYANSLARLEQIKKALDVLEESIRDREGRLSSLTPEERLHLEQTKVLSKNQRLLVLELEDYLARVQAKFEELDRRLDTHEMRLSGLEGREEDLSEQMKELSSRITAHAVDQDDVAYPPVREVEKASAALVRSKLFRLPRTELRLEERGYRTVQVTANASGNLFGVLEAKGTGGVVYDVDLTSRLFIVGPGARPLLTKDGELNREAAGFCAVSRSYVLKGYGSARVSHGLDVYFLEAGAAMKLELGRAVTLGTKTYSGLMLLTPGSKVKDLISHCRDFVDNYVEQTNFTDEIEAVTEVRSLPHKSCANSIQCKGVIKDGWMKYSAVPQCVVQKSGTGVCEMRFANRGGTCRLEGERAFGRRLLCAEGYRCDPHSRRCYASRTPSDELSQLQLEETKYLGTKNGTRRECPDGWRRPTPIEVPALGRWLQLTLREEARLKSSHLKIPAHEWFYPLAAYQGAIPTEGDWLYSLANHSLDRDRGSATVQSHLVCIR